MEGASQVLVLARIKGPGLRASCLLISGHQGLLGQETGWDVAEGEAWACPCFSGWDRSGNLAWEKPAFCSPLAGCC